MSRPTVVVGGGLAGLAAAIHLGRSGRPVLLAEGSGHLGGRADSTTHPDGTRTNLGPHALYRLDALTELGPLGVAVEGRSPPLAGELLDRGESVSSWALLREPALLGWLLRLPFRDPALVRGRSIGAVIDAELASPLARAAAHAVVRVSTYTNAPDLFDAAAALEQVKKALRGNVLYLDGGWRSLVEALEARAVALGVQIAVKRPARAVTDDVVRFDDGEVEHDGVVVATPPEAALRLIDGLVVPPMTPVRAACLDVVLSRLPCPGRTFALGLDRPVYFSVHSRTASFGPGQVVHVAYYLPPGDAPSDVREALEAVLDFEQPGWRDGVVASRYLPHMTVTSALLDGAGRHPGPVPGHPRLHLAGDWVGPTGQLAEASLVSARVAAERLIGAVSVEDAA